jgi:hypothetical protein
MINKLDESLEGVNEFFKSITNRITPNKILFVTLLNGIFLGLITTGFLGDKSISVYSFTFLLFIWQFFVICVFSSSHVNFNAAYLQKFIWIGVIGYAIQWQTFGMIAVEYKLEAAKTIAPIINHPFGNILFTLGCLYGMVACFKGNKSRLEPMEKYTLYNKKERIS